MAIIEPVIRPPSEADSFLLQITTGCSSNNCTFCGAYFGKTFRMKPDEEIGSDIEIGASLHPEIRRVFLMDGDALAVKNQRLLPHLKKINRIFPKLARISSYANGYNITCRSHAELAELSSQKLHLIYLGLESGSQQILDHCRKRSTAEEMTEAVISAAEAGIKSSVIVLLGLGGRRYSEEHVRATVQVLNRMQPRYLSFLTLMLIPGTVLWQERKKGSFEELNPKELLQEALSIMEGLELNQTIFRSDHASNYIPIEGRLPHDKEKLVRILKSAVDGKIILRPDFMRAL
jgi:radical SAM superfamily enzyme YgiQ (UPF0313 family)